MSISGNLSAGSNAASRSGVNVKPIINVTVRSSSQSSVGEKDDMSITSVGSNKSSQSGSDMSMTLVEPKNDIPRNVLVKSSVEPEEKNDDMSISTH